MGRKSVVAGYSRSSSPEFSNGIEVWVRRGRPKYLVTSSDPITGTASDIGRYAVNVSANDVATSGIMPEVIDALGLFPTRYKKSAIEKILYDVKRTALRLGIAVGGARAEISAGLTKPILIVNAVGSGNRFVTASEARPHDAILMTKTAGIEGTSILSKLPRVRKAAGLAACSRGAMFVKTISVVKEAKLAFETGLVHAMHDVTEGGILGAVFEMSLAANIGFLLHNDSIPIDHSTMLICEKLGIDPLKLIGSGSLVIACSAKSSERIIRKLRSSGIHCANIGEFIPLEEGRTLERKGKRIAVSQKTLREELWGALREYGNSS